MKIKNARINEVAQIAEVLAICGLRSDDLCVEGTCYLVAIAEGRIVGTVGIENADGHAVLLRSLAVLPEFRGRGVGKRLMESITGRARLTARSIYLFSTGAGDYYRAEGYVEVSVDEVIAAVGPTPQVKKYEQLGWLPTEIGWRLTLKPLPSGP